MLFSEDVADKCLGDLFKPNPAYPKNKLCYEQIAKNNVPCLQSVLCGSSYDSQEFVNAMENLFQKSFYCDSVLGGIIDGLYHVLTTISEIDGLDPVSREKLSKEEIFCKKYIECDNKPSDQDMLKEKLDVDYKTADALVAKGFTSLEEIANIPPEAIQSVEEFDEKMLVELQRRATDYLLIQEIATDTYVVTTMMVNQIKLLFELLRHLHIAKQSILQEDSEAETSPVDTAYSRIVEYANKKEPNPARVLLLKFRYFLNFLFAGEKQSIHALVMRGQNHRRKFVNKLKDVGIESFPNPGSLAGDAGGDDAETYFHWSEPEPDREPARSEPEPDREPARLEPEPDREPAPEPEPARLEKNREADSCAGRPTANKNCWCCSLFSCAKREARNASFSRDSRVSLLHSTIN